jgi:hypothetical protein
MGIVDGNCRVEIYIHLLDLTRKSLILSFHYDY